MLPVGRFGTFARIGFASTWWKSLARILIVDDDSGFRKTLRLALRSSGYEITDAGSGDEALRSAEASVPDLALVDWQLPGLDGLQTCLRLRTTYGLPVIMISGNRSISRSATLVAGASDFFEKPFVLQELLASIQRLLRN